MNASLACPFCGKNNAAIDTFNYAGGKPAKFRVQCQKCLVATHWCDAEERAWELWNRRVTEKLNHVFSRDAFIFNSLMYLRSQKGNCSAQKEFRGKTVRISKADYVKAYSDCLAICSAELKAAAEAGV